MNPGLIWALVGIALCGAELLHPGVFLLWIGLAAVCAGGVTWLAGMAFPWQTVVFLACLAGSVAIPVLRRRNRPHEDGGVNAPASGLIGKTCRALAFDGAEGRVTFRDGTWSARVASGDAPAPGTLLRIVGLEGTTLVVEPS
ncbi:NfeD family protein [Beijerinckia sp. L45]|uniref:NfeD family protein n=1 Tax=Beijerinckia sp. L45 TaxID=1641855 RepID=UPI00131BE11D|nr:NfeD family protein [Beijerinckia sp. L45]